MNLPPAYAWLPAVEGLPDMVAEALKLYGIHEGVGPADNPVILGWADEVGLGADYKHDSIAWCGLFMDLVAKRAGKDAPEGPLWALNWAKFGQPSPTPGLGDVLTFERPGGGHVALYVAEDPAAYHVLGGNQGDQVSIVRILKSRMHSCRRPIWKTAQPAGVRPYKVSPGGAPVSTNEA